ncbi:MAG TPA: class I SAM-dependent methyltransferase [Ktedonobacterales bacterium]|nr:class I SAM-dependent methyltransferase [Ktedonobacterales bacterium]
MNLVQQTPGAVVLSLTADQQTLVILGTGIVVVVLVVLLAVLLGRWWAGRRRKTAGLVEPVEAPELYDLRTADVTDDIRFCVEMARSVGGPVLELGAGTGRVALPLARTGLVVTGLETSRLMLQRAKLKAEQLSSKLHVEWVEGDITNFSLGGRKFRLILAPFHVLQELRDLNEIEQCLRCVAEHLEPTGKFVVIVQPPRWDALKVERRFLKTVYNPRTNEMVTCYQSLEVDPIWQKLRGEYEYEIWNFQGQMRQVVAPFEGSYLTCPEMALLLRAAGMQMEAVFGSFERDKLTAHSKQMIFVAQPLPAAQPALPAPASSRAAKQSAKAPALAAASVPAAVPAPSAATIVLPESKDKPGAAPGAPQNTDVTAPTLPQLPAPDASGSSSAASSAPAQGVQSPPAPPSSRHTGSQRRHSRPSH